MSYYVAALDRALSEADLRVQRRRAAGLVGWPGEYFAGRILDTIRCLAGTMSLLWGLRAMAFQPLHPRHLPIL